MLEKIGSLITVFLILSMTIGAYFWFDDFANFIATF